MTDPGRDPFILSLTQVLILPYPHSEIFMMREREARVGWGRRPT